MASEVPDKNVPPFDLIFEGRSCFELVVAFVEIAMVLTDNLGNEHVKRVVGRLIS